MARKTADIWRVALALITSIALISCTAASTLDPHAAQNQRFAAIVIDASSGEVLYSKRADAIRYPASLAKMMTLYLLFDHMKANGLDQDSKLPISKNAAGKPASKIHMKPGSSISLDTAIRALSVKSANDVATAVAEYISESEKTFARRMTQRGRELGLQKTVFGNASGLPDEKMVSTARDMAMLTIALRRDHPQFRSYFKLTSFIFKGKEIRGHNRVLGRLRGADGMKTGYTRASGFNLATSLRYGGRNIVAVILGEDTWRERDNNMVELVSKYVPSAKVK
jgi:D-alanyl-D-alanine carboxypeptidase